jgi:DNA (cytosine-5)-methyltransferase 1
MSQKYKVISLFSGAMGLDLGLESTGRFQVVACVEKEPAFCETIRKNLHAGRLNNNLILYEQDINDITPEEMLDDLKMDIGEIDLLVGGPPCQSFSTAGKRRTVKDPRGTLLWEYLRFIEGLLPRFFLMENVRGLLSAALCHRPIALRPDKGGPRLTLEEEPGSVIRLFATDLQKIKDGAYHMDSFEVNAVNYGAPQLRERALFIGNRYNTQVDFPDPTHGRPAPKISSFQERLSGGRTKPLLPWKTLRDAIGNLHEKEPLIMDFSHRKKEYLSMVPPGSNWRSLPIEVQKESMGKAWSAKGGRSGWWRRLSYDLPCPTLITMPNHAGTSLCHPEEVRALSLKEYARVQEFPDDWEFSGTIAQQYAQVGNAVPVRLGNIAGVVISKELDVLREREFAINPNTLPDYRVIYIQSHIRTRQWFKEGETLVWHDGCENGHASHSASRTQRKSRQILTKKAAYVR